MKVFVYGYRKEEAAYFSACAKAVSYTHLPRAMNIWKWRSQV